MSDGLERARERLAELKASGQAIQRLDPIEKAKRNPGSLRLAITAMCWHCAGAGADGQEATRTTIRECTVAPCPLHRHRPYRPQEPEAA